LYLGSEYTRGGAPGRLILYAVPMRALPSMIDLIVTLYRCSGEDDFETYAARVLNRYSEPALAFWLLYNFVRQEVEGAPGRLLLDAEKPENEKAYMARRVAELEGEGTITDLLWADEAFDFREAIVHLERLAFSVGQARTSKRPN
jgi:hypothetical protein